VARFPRKPIIYPPRLREGHPLRRGLVALWPFNPSGGSLKDISVFRKHGSLANMDASQDWIGSNIGSCLDFDGTDDRVDNSNINMGRYAGAMCVIFSTVTTPVGDDYIMTHRTSGTNNRLYLSVYANHATFGFGDNWQAIKTNITVTNGLWHLSLLTWNATDAYAYVDGRAVGSYHYTLAAIPNGTMRFGSNSEAVPADFWAGRIAFAACFNRILSPQDASTLSVDPWGLITPRRRSYFYVQAAAGNRRRRLLICGRAA